MYLLLSPPSPALETLAVNNNTRPEWVWKVPPEAKSLGTFFLLIGQSACCIRTGWLLLSLSFESSGKVDKSPKVTMIPFFLLFTFLRFLISLFYWQTLLYICVFPFFYSLLLDAYNMH